MEGYFPDNDRIISMTQRNQVFWMSYFYENKLQLFLYFLKHFFFQNIINSKLPIKTGEKNYSKSSSNNNNCEKISLFRIPILLKILFSLFSAIQIYSKNSPHVFCGI